MVWDSTGDASVNAERHELKGALSHVPAQTRAGVPPCGIWAEPVGVGIAFDFSSHAYRNADSRFSYGEDQISVAAPEMRGRGHYPEFVEFEAFGPDGCASGDAESWRGVARLFVNVADVDAGFKLDVELG